MIEDWERRYTVRCFDDKQTIPDKDINHLKKFFKYAPSQQSKIDNIWFTLTNEHMDFRIWLLENIFYFVHDGEGNTTAHLSKKQRNESKHKKEYMVSVISAPLVFFNVLIVAEDVIEQDAFRNSGIAAGAVSSEALRLGYDIAFKGCTSGLFWQDNVYKKKENIDKKLETMNELLYKIFGDKLIEYTGKDKIRMFPALAFCIGKGLPLHEPDSNSYDTFLKKYKGYTYFAKGKTKKPWSGVI